MQPKSNQDEQKIINIQQILLKKLKFKTYINSFDLPDNSQAEATININITHKKKAEDLYQVFLKIALESFADEKRIAKTFRVMSEVFGLFKIKGFQDQEKQALFYGFCAHSLFPYVRTHISNITNQSGFKPVLLNPINFEQLYLEKLKQSNNQNTHKPNNPEDKNAAKINDGKNTDNKLKIH